MNRRTFSLATLSAIIVLAGCDSDQKPSHTATLLNNSRVQEAMQGLASAISGLQGAVAGFDDENWREVVPEVQSASSDIDGAFQRLREALNVSGA